MIRLLTLLLGFALFPAAILAGGDLAPLLDVPSLLIAALAPVLIAAGHHGWGGLLDALKAGAAGAATEVSRHRQVLQSLRDLFCAAGALGFLIGLVQLLSNLSDPTAIGPAIAVALLTSLYALASAELLVAPMIRSLAAVEGAPLKGQGRGAATLAMVVLSQGLLLGLLVMTML